MNNNKLINTDSKDEGITISLPSNITNSVTKEDLNTLAIFLQKNLSEWLGASFEEIKASNEFQNKNNNKRFDVIEHKVEQKEISSDQLDSLTDLVKNKATAFVTKNHVQITTEMYESDDFAIAYKKLVDKQIAKICRQIWRDLKKDVLNEHPTKFKNRKIKMIDVDRCSEYVRNVWGGFSVWTHTSR